MIVQRVALVTAIALGAATVGFELFLEFATDAYAQSFWTWAFNPGAQRSWFFILFVPDSPWRNWAEIILWAPTAIALIVYEHFSRKRSR